MKFQAVLGVLAMLITFSWAWKLDLYTTDRRDSKIHGKFATGCVNLEFGPGFKVNRAKFNHMTPIVANPTALELYLRKDCDGLVFRKGGGDHKINPAQDIMSYKVY